MSILRSIIVTVICSAALSMLSGCGDEKSKTKTEEPEEKTKTDSPPPLFDPN